MDEAHTARASSSATGPQPSSEDDLDQERVMHDQGGRYLLFAAAVQQADEQDDLDGQVLLQFVLEQEAGDGGARRDEGG